MTTSASLLLLSVLAVSAGDLPSPIGKQVADFQLNDCLGTPRALANWKDKKAVVVVFFGTQCPLARLYGPRLSELAERYADKGVQFVGIDANQQDSLASIAQFASSHKMDFPVLKDPGNKIADQFGAVRTPEAFLLDQERRVRYWGAIDDQYGVGFSRPKTGKEYLAAALDQVLAGNAVDTPVISAVGCRIGRVSRKAPTGEVTYSKQIARILNQHCVNCHRSGEVAPFPLTSYDEVVGWAETIREVIRAGRMPPWHADPHFGTFRNDARLSDADQKTIYEWVANGVPQGNPRDLPEPPKFVQGWRITQPDVVVRMPKSFTVPAKGVVPYQYFTVDPGFKEDVWVRGAEGRPGNRAVVHHLILFFVAPGQDQPKPQDALVNSVASYVPGMPVNVGPQTHARRIPAGSKLVFQMHYTPNGEEQIDQSEAGLVLADARQVQKAITIGAALNWQFEIPPQAPNHPVEARYRIGQDSILYTLIPHMHLRGKSFRYTAVYPDKREEILLEVPHYDFNWQNTYALKEPKRMPEGTELVCMAHFDNSADNPVNPDPAKAVHWGDQTWEEMVVGTFAMSAAEQDLRLGPPRATARADGRYDVRFRYKPAAAGDSVFLAGEFNGWKPDAQQMDGPDADGYCIATLVLGKGGYEYKFVVNGKNWKQDPGNAAVAGYFNNSVLRVGDGAAKN